MSLNVDFDASKSSPGNGKTIVSYAWDFGDGTPIGSGVIPSHTYASAGDYNVSLTVLNSCGESDTDMRCVRVTPDTKTVTFNSVPIDANVQILT